MTLEDIWRSFQSRLSFPRPYQQSSTGFQVVLQVGKGETRRRRSMRMLATIHYSWGNHRYASPCNTGLPAVINPGWEQTYPHCSAWYRTDAAHDTRSARDWSFITADGMGTGTWSCEEPAAIPRYNSHWQKIKRQLNHALSAIDDECLHI